MDVRTYSASQVVMSFGGAIVEGWETISTSRDLPDFKTVNGIRGKNTRVRNRNTAASVEITLLETSPTNQIFNDIVALDKEIGGARLSFILKDTLGTEVFYSDEAYIEGIANREYAAELGERVWIVRCLSSKNSDKGQGLELDSIFNIS